VLLSTSPAQNGKVDATAHRPAAVREYNDGEQVQVCQAGTTGSLWRERKPDRQLQPGRRLQGNLGADLFAGWDPEPRAAGGFPAHRQVRGDEPDRGPHARSRRQQ